MSQEPHSENGRGVQYMWVELAIKEEVVSEVGRSVQEV
jgi:hypothetical protein